MVCVDAAIFQLIGSFDRSKLAYVPFRGCTASVFRSGCSDFSWN